MHKIDYGQWIAERWALLPPHARSHLQMPLPREIEADVLDYAREQYREWLSSHGRHVWAPDTCEWDHSGTLVTENCTAEQKRALYRTLGDWALGDHWETTGELTGEWTPTFVSGMGRTYRTYGDRINAYTRELIEDYYVRDYRDDYETIDAIFEYAYSAGLIDEQLEALVWRDELAETTTRQER